MEIGGPGPPGPGLLCGGSPRGCRQAPSHKIFSERFPNHPFPLSARSMGFLQNPPHFACGRIFIENWREGNGTQ
jgi:hypothetical protein